MSDSPQLNSLDCWDYTIELECLRGTEDLQLAAELGKTLLERNKELETSLKQHLNVIEDQTQEIEYLTKQTVALREVNDSRLRIYEQLEVSIQDLERANHRLAVENSNDKKHIKSLTATIETLEAKCEELQGNIDDLKIELDIYKKKTQRSNETAQQHQLVAKYVKLRHVELDEVDRPVSPDSSVPHSEHDECANRTRTTERCQETQTTPSKDQPAPSEPDVDPNVEQLSQLMSQLRELNAQCSRDQRRITELEEQLTAMVHQNQELEQQLTNVQNKDADLKSMHDELNTLEEVRQGQLCCKCLRSVDPRDDMSLSLCDDREDDDSSMLEALTNSSQHRSSFSMEVQAYAKTTPPRQGEELYKDLVEKYEALVKVQKTTMPHRAAKPANGNIMSLQEELAMSSGDFAASAKDTDEESGHGDSLRMEQQKKCRKAFSQTPTDFSEAETSSSGFSDETSNKATQTDRRPGSFLCTIGDGEDCFSIYDDAANIEGRFRNRPEYRELFSEIFGVLKKAASGKEESEQVRLLDEREPGKAVPKVPPVTPCTENLPDFPDNCTDDTQSVLSSTMSEISTSQAEPTTVIENIKLNPPKSDEPVKSNERVLTPLVRQPLEYLSVGVNVRKRSSSRRKKQFAERSDSPVTHIVGSPTIKYSNRAGSGRRRRDHRNNENENNWNGNTIQFWSNTRNVASPTPSQGSAKSGYKYDQQSGFEFKPSTASQDLHMLKKLDLSYAEVLRNADAKKREISRYKRK